MLGGALRLYPRTRLVALATAAYGAYALAQPEHLHTALPEDVTPQESRRLAHTYAGRDLPISLVGLLGPSTLVPVALGMRVAADLTDAATLGASTTGGNRAKVLGVTLGWAAVNLVAFRADRRVRPGLIGAVGALA
jgi:hypothetical protein